MKWVQKIKILIVDYYIDIKSGFNYNSDDIDDINIGLVNNSNIKKRNTNANQYI